MQTIFTTVVDNAKVSRQEQHEKMFPYGHSDAYAQRRHLVPMRLGIVPALVVR